ncbi:MAG: 6-phosphofructokinase [Bacillota bacterium]
MMKRLGVLTGGGDCPGLNAVIRAVAKTAFIKGYEVIGFLDGYNGLVEGKYLTLGYEHISGILHRGGTILGTNNRDNPFHFPVGSENGKPEYRDLSDQALTNLNNLGIESLIAIGGDGSLSCARDFCKKGAKIVGVPKTIDNDLAATDQTFGFDTAVTTVSEALDRLHTTAESHHRVMVLEVMGRYAGWIALQSGLAGGADVILIPEITWDIKHVAHKVMERKEHGKPFSLVVVAEGAKLPGGDMVVSHRIEGSADPIRLGGVGQLVTSLIQKETGVESRITVLGHIQRGGSPTAFDRVLATRFGAAAAELAIDGQYGKMVSLQGWNVVPVPLEEATARLRLVPPDGQMVHAARSIGICFGDGC